MQIIGNDTNNDEYDKNNRWVPAPHMATSRTILFLYFYTCMNIHIFTTFLSYMYIYVYRWFPASDKTTSRTRL